MSLRGSVRLPWQSPRRLGVALEDVQSMTGDGP